MHEEHDHLHTHSNSHSHEHTHSYGHSHEHAHGGAHPHGHAHGDGHSHEHVHGNGHPHEHVHEHNHGHAHDHAHDHGNSEAPGASPKDVALLKYMLDHNKQHAFELAEAGGRLASAGLEGAAELISDAVNYFDHANEKLENAVKLIGGDV